MVLDGEASVHCLPIEIRIRGDGRLIDEFRLVDGGPFNRKIKLPSEGSDSSLVDIEILASAHFVPRKLRQSRDRRRLSFRLQQLALIDAQGHPMTLYGKQ